MANKNWAKVEAEFEQASALMKEKNYKEAVDKFNNAANQFLTMGNKGLEYAVYCYYHMAGMFRGNDTNSALICIEKAVEVFNVCEHFSNVHKASILDRYGEILADAEKYKEAQGEYLKSIKIREKLSEKAPGEFDCAMAETYVKINVILAKIGDYKYSTAGFFIAKGLYQKAFKNGDKTALAGVANCYDNLAIIYKLTGKYSDAKESAFTALDKWEWLALNVNIDYKNRLASAFNELIEIHKKAVSPLSEIEQSYLKLAEIYERLAEINPGYVCEDLAGCYRSLANLNPGIFKMKKAKEYKQMAEDVYKRFGQ